MPKGFSSVMFLGSVMCGLTVDECFKAVTINPSKSLQIDNVGVIQKGFTLELEYIDQEKSYQLAQFLFDTKNVTKLKIKGLSCKWNILRTALEGKPELRFDNLKELSLANNAISYEIFEEINNILISCMTSLTYLNLGCNSVPCANYIGCDGAIAIAESENMKSLTYLNLCGIRLSDDGVSAIAESEYMASLTSLNLYTNHIGDSGATAIANSSRLAGLTNLNLKDNLIKDDGATAFAELKHMESLVSLDLSVFKTYDSEIRDCVKVVIRNQLRKTHPKCSVKF